jgi:hypothetical protein
MWRVPLLRVYKTLPSNGSTCYTAPSLRLFVLKSLQAYCHFFFSEGWACDVCERPRLPSPWLSSHGDYSPIALPAPSLRLLVLSGSLTRCELVQVYHHQPRSRASLVGMGKVLRVVDAPTSLTLKLLVVSSFTSEGAKPSTIPSHSLPITWQKSWPLTSRPLVQNSADSLVECPLTS